MQRFRDESGTKSPPGFGTSGHIFSQCPSHELQVFVGSGNMCFTCCPFEKIKLKGELKMSRCSFRSKPPAEGVQACVYDALLEVGRDAMIDPELEGLGEPHLGGTG